MEKDKIISDCKVLMFGGSAGSLEVLMKILPRLDAALSFPIVLVLHRKSGEDTNLEDLVAMKSRVPVQEVEDKVPLLPGFVYVAPSDYHLLFEKDGLLSLDTSEKVNYSRPSIDVSFESASDAYGQAVVAILLSGANADGTEGLKAIKDAGGIIIVQKPETAEVPFMPANAISNTFPDYIFDAEEIVEFIGLRKK